jgi:hypothetical protein
LPTLPIPLLEPDPDAVFDLGAAVAEVYERGGYANLINYTRQPPPPPLDENSARWLEDHLRYLMCDFIHVEKRQVAGRSVG